MRSRRGPHPRVPPTNGKRSTGRQRHGRHPTRVRIEYTPRPHLQIQIYQETLWALLDSGSEALFVSAAIADRMRTAGVRIRPREDQINMAIGTKAPITGTLRATIKIDGRTIRHCFQILPKLSSEVLIGTDLWGRLQINIPPPPTTKCRHTTRARLATLNSQMTPGLIPRSEDEDRNFRKFLAAELQKFENIQGPTNQITHRIRLKTGEPIKQRYRPRNPAMQAVINDEVNKMLAGGVIEPSNSAWSSPVVLVKKKGTYRFCIDFRKLNQASQKDAYPLLQVLAILDKLRGARYLSTLDLKDGYWQVPLETGSRPATAFTIPGRGLFQFRVIPFGLYSAPATFQRLLDTVMGPKLEPHVLVYLDDIIVASPTLEAHQQHFAEVFHRLRKARLRLNTKKCHFCQDQLKYLGHLMDKDGIRTDPDKVSAVTGWPVPRTMRQIRRF